MENPTGEACTPARVSQQDSSKLEQDSSIQEYVELPATNSGEASSPAKRSEMDSFQSSSSLMSYSSSPLFSDSKRGVSALDTESEPSTPSPKRSRMEVKGHVSLAYFYNELLPSPDIDGSTRTNDLLPEILMRRFWGPSNLPGLKTTLYEYQKRSAMAMILQEEDPKLLLDPRLEKRVKSDGTVDYFDSVTQEITKEPREYYACQGGILAESMGLGKTLICLAVILATKSHHPSMPMEFSSHLKAQKGARSLLDMVSRKMIQHRFPWTDHFEELGKTLECRGMTQALKLYTDRYFIPPHTSRHPRAVKKEWKDMPQEIFMSKGTIIICPTNLIGQWQAEIAKHVEEHALAILVVKDSKMHLPAPQYLAQFDIVLFSRSRFDDEPFSNPVQSPGVRKPHVTCDRNSNHPMCASCFTRIDLDTSPVQSIHWKRLIVDEGHSMKNKQTNSAILIERLIVERRWLVSGTPSRALIGCDVERAAVETDMQNNSTDDDDNMQSPLHESFRGKVPPWHDPPRKNKFGKSQKQRWTDRDRVSLCELGRLVTNFLQVKPWHLPSGDGDAKAGKWTQYFGRGQEKFSNLLSPALQRTLEHVLIKHRPEDVKKDVALPPISNRIVYLEPSLYDRASHNLFALNIISNQVMTKRTGADYLFDPRNRKSRMELINNLRHGSFYWTGFEDDAVNRAISLSQGHLTFKNIGTSNRDHRRLSEAVEAAALALELPLRMPFYRFQEMGCFVADVPVAGRSILAINGQRTNPTCIGLTVLLKTQEHIAGGMGQGDPSEDLGFFGPAVLYEARSAGASLSASASASASANVSVVIPTRRANNNGTLTVVGNHLVDARAHYRGDAETPATPANTLGGHGQRGGPVLQPVEHGKLKTGGNGVGGQQSSDSVGGAKPTAPDPPAKPESLSSATLVGTASSKCSYLVDQILEFHQTEKILIFYEADYIVCHSFFFFWKMGIVQRADLFRQGYYISQMMDVCDIPHLIYASGVHAPLRSSYLQKFNQGEDYRVLLMDLRQASHGLDISSASRIYFVNPVWRADVEAQTIKRAHRIGQTKPVVVETLVLKGTLEEKMLQRRAAWNQTNPEDVPLDIMDDPTMSDIIQNVEVIRHWIRGENGKSPMAPLQHKVRVFSSSGASKTAEIRAVQRRLGTKRMESKLD
ncbi:MAG: hypothetical protein M1823_006229 [Watsoniomyces obsoletus]|nr:MAG: hypothetical protein M1823_006229 [Watsoniomyces obsoletus]